MDILIIVISIISALILVLSVVIVYLLIKRSNTTQDQELINKDLEQQILVKMAEQIGNLKEHMAVVMAQAEKTSTSNFVDFSDKTMKVLQDQIEIINKKVDERLGEGFEKTNKTFENVIERLAKIDEAQKNIETLSSEVVSLSNVLTDKKTRGMFGEMQLEQIFESIFGENKPDIYQRQYTLSNKSIADMVLFAPEPLGTICIDSKFPLENYQRMFNPDLTDAEKATARKGFQRDIKIHIDDISKKYIIDGETASQAIMFVPAEAIFAEISAYHESVVSYAYDKKVVITSPTTLMYTLSVVYVILKDIERSKYSEEIKKQLDKLSVEFGRFATRWNSFRRTVSSMQDRASELDITSDKIIKRFQEIENVEKSVLIEAEEVKKELKD